MAVALSCYYHRIPFGHVEAGLRTHNLYNPYPEEMNRVVAGHLATWHFAPTERAKSCLLGEGIKPDAIRVTGNTVIDALLQVAEGATDADIGVEIDRRTSASSWSPPTAARISALRLSRSAVRYAGSPTRTQTCKFSTRSTPTPTSMRPAHALLGGHPRIRLCAPLDYKPFVAAMKRAYFILTDSGGVQEEAPALGKPVLVLRNETERPEAIEMGVVKLVGVDTERIIASAQELLTSEEAYRRMAKGVSPYGDGHAAERIASALLAEVVTGKMSLEARE